MIYELTDTDIIQPGDFVRFDFGGRTGSWDRDFATGRCYPCETVASRRARYEELGAVMRWGRPKKESK